jgi:hypothetical protein
LQGRVFWRGGFNQGTVHVIEADRSYLAAGLPTGPLNAFKKRERVVGVGRLGVTLFDLHGEPDSSENNHDQNCRCYPPGVAIEFSDYLTRLG